MKLKRLPIWLALCATGYTGVVGANALPVDSDLDGLSDTTEMAIGFNPNYFDSNMNGISDLIEAQNKGLVDADRNPIIQPSRALSADDVQETCMNQTLFNVDTDQDGIPNFYETYGVFHFHSLQLVKRKMMLADQNEFNSKGDSFQFAMETLQQSGFVSINGEDVFIDLGGADAVLCNAFAEKSESDPSYRSLASFDTLRVGSIGNIMMKLLNDYELVSPMNPATMEPLAYYFLSSTKLSSESDPYSDWDELVKTNHPDSLKHPYNHPSVAAEPRIEARLINYTVIPQGEITNSEGQSVSNSWSQETTHSTEQTTSWEVSVGIESEVSFTPSATVSVEASVGGSVTQSTDRTTGSEESKSFDWSKEFTSDKQCPARVKFNVEIANVGGAPAKDVDTRYNLFIGNKLVSTFDAGVLSGIFSPGKIETVQFPMAENGSESVGICLSQDELQLIQLGGSITLETVIESAQILAKYDGSEIYEAEWESYSLGIANNTARINLDIEQGNDRIEKQFQILPGNGFYSLTLRDALDILVSSKELPEHTIFGIVARDQTGRVLDGKEREDTIKALLDNGTDMLDLPLQKKWEYNILTLKNSPKAGYPNIHKIDYDEKNKQLSVYASDDLGVKNVHYCETSDKCLLMTKSKEGVNEYQLSNVNIPTNLSTNYLVKVLNTRNNESTAKPPFESIINESIAKELSKNLSVQQTLLSKINNEFNWGDSGLSTTQLDNLKSGVSNNISRLIEAIGVCNSDQSSIEDCKRLYHQVSKLPEYIMPKTWHSGFSIGHHGWEVDKHPRLLGDVNGDGKADIVGFAHAATVIALSTGDGFKTTQSLEGFQYSGGWRTESHPRMLADVNGDGYQDIVGFSDLGVEVATSNKEGHFTFKGRWLNDFGNNVGVWRVHKHPRIMADVNGDGKADVVGFGDHAVVVALSTGKGFEPARVAHRGFDYDDGWRVGRHLRFLKDVNGDGRADIVGFAEKGVHVALANESGGFGNATKWVDGFTPGEGGWDAYRHPRMMEDVNGDGKADIVGFGEAGTVVALSTGSSFQLIDLQMNQFGTNQGWDPAYHPRYLADVNGDGLKDIVGLHSDGVLVSVSNGNSFQQPTFQIRSYGIRTGGWSTRRHPRQVADVNGDGRADIVGFAERGVYVASLLYSDANPKVKVALKSWQNLYLVAESNGGNQVNANRSSAGSWETFSVYQLSGINGCLKHGDQVALATDINHYYLGAQTGNMLKAWNNKIGTNEQFVFINNSDRSGCMQSGDSVAFRSPVTNNYISAHSNKTAFMNAWNGINGQWENFRAELR